ncbi:hypothetical protein MMC25_005633 [Agyrium rufum]|nr:hypothetical protein [Agyrium rufum]
MLASEEVAAAKAFLDPVLNRDSISKARGRSANEPSVIHRLAVGNGISVGSNSDPRRQVIRKALHLIITIHQNLIRAEWDGKALETLYDSSQRRIIDALFDLISLEGIYPNLQPGVGIPLERRVQSLLKLKGKPGQELCVEKEFDVDDGLLIDIVEQLRVLTKKESRGLSRLFHERGLVDLIAAVGQLAYASADTGNVFYNTIFKTILTGSPTKVLLEGLTALLHENTPLWFRPHLTNALSTLPLRDDGVEQTLLFLKRSASQTNDYTTDIYATDSGPLFSLEVLSYASKLLSSAPTGMEPSRYLQIISKPLIELLDGDNADMRRASAYIISNGVLSKRAYGSPGTIGWQLFADPIHAILNPVSGVLEQKRSGPTTSGSKTQVEVLSKNHNIGIALRRLQALTLMHPNPGTAQRLLKPILLPLWGLLCHTKEDERAIEIFEISSNLLMVFLRYSPDITGYVQIADKLSFDGGINWAYFQSLEGLELRAVPAANPAPGKTLEHFLLWSHRRATAYIQLVESGGLDDSDIADIFLHVAGCWLQGDSNRHHRSKRYDNEENANRFERRLQFAKLAQELLERYKELVSKQPVKLLRLLQDILNDYVHHHEALTKGDSLSLPRLDSIVQHDQDSELSSTRTMEPTDPSELLSVTLSLLMTILSSPSFDSTPHTDPILSSLHLTLVHLYETSHDLPQSTLLSCRNVSSLLLDLSSSSLLSGLGSDSHDAPSSVHPDIQLHEVALQNLSSPLPPIRAQGISTMTNLISSSSPILAIPSTTILLVSLLQDEEEYIYLAVIKALEILAVRHSKTVVNMLVDRYVDPDEDSTLDARLKMGEALRKTMEGLGQALTGDAASCIGEGMIAVAGRRGERKKEIDLAREKGEASKEEVENAWGGEIPSFSDDDEDPLDRTNNRVASERLRSILAGWHAPPGAEDLRIRSSAVSILGLGFETNIGGFSPLLVTEAIDLVLSVLQLETGDEHIILRRASVIMIHDIIAGLDKAEGDGRQIGFSLDLGGAERLHRILGYVREKERDNTLRGHLEVVLDGLDRWRVQGMVTNITNDDLNRSSSFMDDQLSTLSGLNMGPGRHTQGSRLKIEELE